MSEPMGLGRALPEGDAPGVTWQAGTRRAPLSEGTAGVPRVEDGTGWELLQLSFGGSGGSGGSAGTDPSDSPTPERRFAGSRRLHKLIRPGSTSAASDDETDSDSIRTAAKELIVDQAHLLADVLTGDLPAKPTTRRRDKLIGSSVLFDAPGPKTKRVIMVANIVGGAIVAAILFMIGLKLAENGQLEPAMWRVTVEPVSWTAYFIPGLVSTLLAAVVAIIGAFVFGLVFGVARLAANPIIRLLAGAIVEFCRAVPVLLMMIFLWNLFGSVHWPDPSFWAVAIALILYNGSVCAELVRSGVINLPTGQHEAASAVGLTKAQALRHVLIPQALLSMLPALIAQLVVALKDSALGMAIAYSELLRQANLLGTPINTIQTLFVASVIFIIINYTLGKLGERLARKMRGRGLELDEKMAEDMPMNVSAAGTWEMLEDPDAEDVFDESSRLMQQVTGRKRHL